MDFAEINIVSPVMGATYTQGQVVPIVWNYVLPPGRTTVGAWEGADHRQKHQGQKENLQFLDTSRIGHKRIYHFRVVDNLGNVSAQVVNYSVVE